MRFYRGVSVSSEMRDEVQSRILRQGFADGDGWWDMRFRRPRNPTALISKIDLTTVDTREQNVDDWSAVCACGEMSGAAYYAYSHNRSEGNDAPLVIEFEADASAVAVDGRDFLYTAFQLGTPDRARAVLTSCFGASVLQYAERAWKSDDQQYRIAMCDLAIHDPSVVVAHYENRNVIGGRFNTVFCNAFLVKQPIPAAAIIAVRADVGFDRPSVHYDLSGIRD